MSLQIYSLLAQTEGGKKGLFWKGARRGTTLQDCHLFDMTWKVSPFVKFEIIISHYRTWTSMINLRIDSRTCQKQRILLSARPRCNYNYLELSKENVLRNMLSHWSCSTWKFFMIWFHKILKIILKASIMP